ncbi:putative pantetheine-phosphate adenylyltransferase KNAG_0K00220 [Huiozyma naganishii CBS 8797]|uniref:Cytidyltransferase-like domain-containing protein n=1 Tax=Huiozyma naganishii (strain ATCC MYA-139 / BCRC 22969 / CBS 8797 / KCTC 17520 / NBRC 10181 / NCYC 3082 / Yp74L-3) TaxID=1071383 RepID=J7RBV8_HUIN7|nr:hypothetical protein KNAG_0K00220 [Kazachstania naganishii CBS 8797]CCK72390.1 hypothetical protein KNAG_0K00220 [Kazachstania naganishii CBS 8797]
MRVGIVLQHCDALDFEELQHVVEGILSLERIDRAFQENRATDLDLLLLSDIKSSFHLDNLLGKLYTTLREILFKRGLPLFPINVLLGNFNREETSWDELFVTDRKVVDVYRIQHTNLNILPKIKNHDKVSPVANDPDPHTSSLADRNKYDVTALGGTFDHIHDGHKILLTVAAFITSSRLIIGLTGKELLGTKKFPELLEDYETRKGNVCKFLKLLKPQLRVEMVLLKDVCGPTGTVPEIKALVVSRETLKGGDYVNKTRREKGMHELDISVVNVIGGEEEDGWTEKLSSTDVRRMLSEEHTHT